MDHWDRQVSIGGISVTLALIMREFVMEIIVGIRAASQTEASVATVFEVRIDERSQRRLQPIEWVWMIRRDLRRSETHTRSHSASSQANEYRTCLRNDWHS